MTKKIEKIEKIVLKIAIQIAKTGEGALLVIGDDVNYSNMMDKRFGKLSVFDKGAEKDRKSTRLNSSHIPLSRMPSSA